MNRRTSTTMMMMESAPILDPDSVLLYDISEDGIVSDASNEYYISDQELEANLIPASNTIKSELLTKLIKDLDDSDEEIKLELEDGYNYWGEDKLFEETVLYEKSHELQPDPTQNLLSEFESVFNAINNGAFTPPQSPPTSQPVLLSLEPISQINYPANIYHIPYFDERKVQSNLSIVLDPKAIHTTDIAHELAVVDELVKSRVEYLVPSSPSSSSSSYSNDGSTSDDPEWELNVKPQMSYKEKSRKRPYRTEEKRSRKKEQNKNAATRYRLKKKAEIKEIMGEETVLIERSNDLRNNITDLQREIKCLKGLMRDMFKAKGLIT